MNLHAFRWLALGCIWFQATALAQNAVAPTKGDGSSGNPYQITVIGNLAWLHDQAATGKTYKKYYKLMNHLDASAAAKWNDAGTDESILEGFNPIGNDLIHPFNGTFDGNGHTIDNLTINRQLADYVGMFGYVGPYGTIKNLKLSGGSITGKTLPASSVYLVGALVGYNQGNLVQCGTSGTRVKAGYSSDTGGLVGRNEGSISDSFVNQISFETAGITGGLIGRNTGPVSGSRASGSVSGVTSGGLIGYNTGPVTQSSASCTVTNGSMVGGLIGFNAGVISYCSASGNVKGGKAGGLIGDNGTTVTYSFASGAVTGGNESGGLIGSNGGNISYCYASGPITGSDYVGGLIGRGENASNCYATGSVTGGWRIGGLIGRNDHHVINCYAAGQVKGSYDVGGLVGENYVSITKSYAGGAVSGLDTVGALVGKNYGSIANALGAQKMNIYIAPSTDLKKQSTFAGWDFTNIWGIQGGTPYLRQLTNYTVTYQTVGGGTVGNGDVSGSKLVQIVNTGCNCVPITAYPASGRLFAGWSDGNTSNPRTVQKITANVTITAIFRPANAVRDWLRYR